MAQAERLDRELAPVSDLLFAGAALQPGERVLDVGCGTGPTTRAAASVVGEQGWVGGIDVAGEMLAAAADIGSPAGAAPIEWIEANVETWDGGIEPVDAVISRFGVMFFADPKLAFATLAAATRAGGRLCAMVWDRRDRSEKFQVPLAATLATMRAAGLDVSEPAVDDAAFSLHDPAHVAPILEAAGWTDVGLEPHAVSLHLGGGMPPEEGAEVATSVGPSRVVTGGIDDGLRAKVLDAVAAALADHVDGDGHVVLPGSVIRITARRG